MHRAKAKRTATSVSLVLLLLPLPGSAAQETAKGNDLDLVAVYEETEAILDWSDDPFSDLFVEEGPLVFWSAQIRGGAGNSSNFLKRKNAVSSRFLKTEGDFFLNALSEASSLTVLFYGEYLHYDRDSTAESETLAFFNGNWKRVLQTASYGIELGAFYGDQIYDASLTVASDPLGTSLRQFRPEAEAFIEWSPGGHDLLKVMAGLERTWFGNNKDDYWRPRLAFSWTHAWARGLKTATEMGLYREYYEEDIPRTSTGLPLEASDKLEISGIRIEEVLTWKSDFLENLDFSLRFGAAREIEQEGRYKGLNRYWGSLATIYKWKLYRFSLTARWQNTRYQDRQAGISDTRNLHQRYRSMKMEIGRDFPWNTSLKASVQWNDFDSRASEDSFSGNRVEIILGWTY